MKIVLVSCFNYYSVRIKTIYDYFKKMGNEVYYLTSDYNHFTKSYEIVAYPDTKQLHVPKYSKNISMRRLYSHLIFSRKVMMEINSICPDAIYAIIPPNSLVKMLIAYKKKNGTKVYLDVFDFWPEMIPLPRFLLTLLTIPLSLWKSLRNRYINKADLVISVSEEGKKLLLGMTPNINCKVLLPASDAIEQKKAKQNIGDKIVFCYLGNVNNIIDIDVIEKLFLIVGMKKKVILHLIGDGDKKEELTNRLNLIGVTVISHGTVFDDSKKTEILSECVLGLNVPRKEIQSSMALKTIEYLRFGLPYINTGIGDSKTIVEKKGVGFNLDRDDIEDTAKKVIELDEHKLFEMSSKCIKCYNELFASQNLAELFDLE